MAVHAKTVYGRGERPCQQNFKTDKSWLHKGWSLADVSGPTSGAQSNYPTDSPRRKDFDREDKLAREYPARPPSPGNLGVLRQARGPWTSQPGSFGAFSPRTLEPSAREPWSPSFAKEPLNLLALVSVTPRFPG